MRKFLDEQRKSARQIASPDAHGDNFVGRAIILMLVATEHVIFLDQKHSQQKINVRLFMISQSAILC